MRRSLTRKERLRRGRDIREVFAEGRRVEAGGLRLLHRANGSSVSRIAVVVGRGCGGAVRRNREKRITREAWRALKSEVVPGHDVVLLVGRFGVPLSERQAALRRLLVRSGLSGRAEVEMKTT
jgi:ribonuclease P protein component